jgi:ABC-type amino acid transport substrate-binding protein
LPDNPLSLGIQEIDRTVNNMKSAFPRVCACVAVLWVSLSAQAAAPKATSGHLPQMAASGEMRVCVWPDYYGISYRNRKTLALEGIDVDLARQLAQDLKLSVKFVDSSFATLIDDVVSDRCDIAMFAIGITPARAEKLRFTTPHLRSDIYAITTRSNRRIQTWADIDKPGVVVAVAKGTYHEPVMRERLKAATLLVVDTPAAREQEVESGRADVFMTDYPFSRRMLDNVDWARLVSPPGTFHLTPYAWAMKPGDDAWFNRVESFVKTIESDGRLLAAARRHHLEPIVTTKPAQ